MKKELPYLKDKYGVEKDVLYGSFAKGKQKKKSDIDILVDLRKTLGLEFVELADRLEEILGRKVTLQHLTILKEALIIHDISTLPKTLKRA